LRLIVSVRAPNQPTLNRSFQNERCECAPQQRCREPRRPVWHRCKRRERRVVRRLLKTPSRAPNHGTYRWTLRTPGKLSELRPQSPTPGEHPECSSMLITGRGRRGGRERSYARDESCSPPADGGSAGTVGWRFGQASLDRRSNLPPIFHQDA